jgi:Periplasmic binding protein
LTIRQFGGQPTTILGDDMTQTRCISLAFIVLGLSVSTNPAAAEKKYDPGATDNEIKIGNIMPYSGPLSAYALIGRTEAAFFNRINAEGGINGRKINFVTYDDAFSPPKTVEQARKLVESDEVLPTTPGTSRQPPRSSTARSSCRPPTAPPISPFCRTSSRADPPGLC